ncbi:hypothetical protein [Kitasatospora sp. NPDC057015]|uniref:hypothetical protein n=1 Tax=Kitasatospora sp. NPDC057015 TaxID=3346001 RepID=UPI00363B86D5
MGWSTRSRRGVGPVLAGAVLALAGCSGAGSGGTSADGTGGPAATTAQSSPSPSPTAAPTPTTSPTPRPVADCTDTSAFTQQQLHDYLVKLPSKTGTLNGLHTSYDGVHFDPAFDHRACKALYVNVTHFWVLVSGTAPATFNPNDWRSGIPGLSPRPRIPGLPTSTRTPGQQAEYTYEAISTTPLALTLGVGLVVGTRPPEPEHCKGTLTVVHLGDAITDQELPETLRFEPTTIDHGASTVTVKADRALHATLVPPSSTTGC